MLFQKNICTGCANLPSTIGMEDEVYGRIFE